MKFMSRACLMHIQQPNLKIPIKPQNYPPLPKPDLIPGTPLRVGMNAWPIDPILVAQPYLCTNYFCSSIIRVTTPTAIVLPNALKNALPSALELENSSTQTGA